MKRKHVKLIPLAACLCTAQAAVSNPVVVGNSRFTFITPHLVRMEHASEGRFLDDPTLFAIDRTARYDSVKVERQEDNRYILSTPAMRIEYIDDGFPFGQTNLHVYFKNDSDPKERHWYIASRQRRNLQGALATLDEVNGPVKRQEGLLSRDGWYLINDTGKETLRDGWLTPRDRKHVQDLYLFIYGDDYKAALRALRAIGGPAPMPRKYIHGAWYCRWWNYTDDDYRQIAREYREHGFPLDIIVFDMGWHTHDARVGTGHAGTRSWTGYSWNRGLIKDPARLIREFKDDRIHVVLNEHPHDGLRPHEDAWPAFARELGLETTARAPLFDAGDRRYMEAFMKHAHAESDAMGVAFWWLDWQQDYLYPLVRGTNTPHLPWLNKLYYDHSARNGLRGAGFSRWGGWGDHRHPIQFSGDAAANWNVLRFEVDLTTSSGNAGCFFWAHDIGGFYGGRDAELYTRWTQFGMLTSSLRIHSVNDEKLDRRPWLWGEEAEHAMRRAYHLRSRLMPYTYTSVRQCYTDMLPLNRGLYIEYPDREEAYRHPGQFLFGDLLLAAPVTSAGQGAEKTASQQVWLPDGCNWYHLFNGKAYTGGQIVTIDSPLNEFPLFVKGGYPIPMQPYTERMTSTPLTELIVRCYPGEPGSNHSYDLYEDDGLTTAYQQGDFAVTTLNYRNEDGKVTVTICPAAGNYAGQPRQRAYRIELPGVKTPSRVTVNGKRTKIVYDETLQGRIVSIPATDIRKEVVVCYIE
jgi:alpha-glucosidase (family GH31 glycosyl hydrolase)